MFIRTGSCFCSFSYWGCLFKHLRYSLTCSCNSFQLNTYLVFIVFLIDLEGGAVVAVGDTVTCNPLSRVMSSLGLYSCHLSFLTKIHLQPLLTVKSCGDPWASLGIHPGIEWFVWRVVLAGSCDLGIGYTCLLHPEWVWTCYTRTVKEKKGQSWMLLKQLNRRATRPWCGAVVRIHRPITTGRVRNLANYAVELPYYSRRKLSIMIGPPKVFIRVKGTSRPSDKGGRGGARSSRTWDKGGWSHVGLKISGGGPPGPLRVPRFSTSPKPRFSNSNLIRNIVDKELLCVSSTINRYYPHPHFVRYDRLFYWAALKLMWICSNTHIKNTTRVYAPYLI